MPLPGQELSSINFESLIGGPLIAVVHAQAQSAMTTVDFIKTVGFKAPEGETAPGQDTSTLDPIYVSFQYPKELAPYTPAQPEVRDESGTVVTPAQPAKEAVYQTQELRVPILTMLPVPYLRIEETTVDFNAKINSVEFTKTDTRLKVDAEAEAKFGWLTGSARLKVNVSYQRNTQQGNSVNRTYSMAVHVRAVQDETPEGVARILGILEGAITSTPANAAAPA